MASNNVDAISAFIDGAPPGELTDVVNDIKTLITHEPSLLPQAEPAFQKYNEEQLTVVKLPGSGKDVIVSAYNSLGEGRYYDVGSGKSWFFDHVTQKASDVQDHPAPSTIPHTDLIAALTKSLALHASEHYPSSVSAVVPPPSSSSSSSSSSISSEDSSTITLLLVSSKYSPSNFWNGRLRTIYTFAPATSTLSGTLKCDVHYYEDGNVRLTTTKTLPESKVSGPAGGLTHSGADVVRDIGKVERKWQEELNKGFALLSEESFKGLRRQLPVTRQKMEWEKVGGLRVGREIGGLPVR